MDDYLLIVICSVLDILDDNKKKFDYREKKNIKQQWKCWFNFYYRLRFQCYFKILLTPEKIICFLKCFLVHMSFQI